MKKIIFLLPLAVLLLCGCQVRAKETSSDSHSSISGLVSEYSLRSDFEVIRLGRLGMGLVRTVLRNNMDHEDMEVLDLIRDVKKIVVANYGDCEASVRDEFVSRLNRLLDKDCLLLEAKDSGERLSIYGEASDSGDRITNLIINAPDSGALICIYGTIPTESISKAMKD